MRLHRFIVPGPLKVGEVSIEDPELLKQWRSVLRILPKDKLIVSDGRGSEGVAVLQRYERGVAILEVEEFSHREGDGEVQLTLFLSILKKENFELVSQKATEIGVHKIVPVITSRTVKLGLNHERLLKIIKEAAEQSGRVTVPELLEARRLVDILVEDFDRKIIFDGQGESPTRGTPRGTTVAVLVGPEGGFEPVEIEMAREKGWKAVSLGDTTLRAETAAIVGTYVAFHSLV